MKIPLNEIKPSPNPIRKTWDEEKMEELKWSLMEEGQVEPIGVRENGAEYIIVWGHRRVEAAKRANWDEIDCVIVPNDEVNNLIQAGIENLAGEDMSADEKADWAFRLTELGLSQREIARRSCIHIGTINQWLDFRREKLSGVYAGVQSISNDEGVKKTVTLGEILGDDLSAKKSVAAKIIKDELTQSQTRAVAEAYRDAPTPAIKAQVLKTPIISRDTAADILRRSINRVEMDTGIKQQEEMNDFRKEREERREMEDWDFAVKEFLDATKLYAQLASKGSVLVKYGKFTPEAARFTIRKIDALIDLLKTYKEQLGEVQ